MAKKPAQPRVTKMDKISGIKEEKKFKNSNPVL